MRPATTYALGAALAAPGVLFSLILWPAAVRGQEPSRLGRLFRLNTASNAAPAPAPTPAPGLTDPRPPLTPSAPASTAAPARLVPQPRVSRAATEADPLVTRISLARSDDGSQFGMLLQVYADGTVIDSTGVHHLGREEIKGVLQALDAGELFRPRGHCGGPPTDFVEQVQMVVFERSLGRLRANAFSFSGNPQGCDHAVKHLQTALDALQDKLTRPATTAAAPATPAPAATPAPTLRLNDGLDSGGR